MLVAMPITPPRTLADAARATLRPPGEGEQRSMAEKNAARRVSARRHSLCLRALATAWKRAQPFVRRLIERRLVEAFHCLIPSEPVLLGDQQQEEPVLHQLRKAAEVFRRAVAEIAAAGAPTHACGIAADMPGAEECAPGARGIARRAHTGRFGGHRFILSRKSGDFARRASAPPQFFTSPLGGEVGERSEPGEGVRDSRESSAPSPQPSPPRGGCGDCRASAHR